VRPLLIDDALPHPLVGELHARGREALAADGAASDADLLAAAAVAGAVLVTSHDDWPPHPAAPVAIVAGRSMAERRDAVHRWAHAMAAQRPGSVRRYRP
jgi:hypothetical protein